MPAQIHVDVLIIGGGPAGTSLALLLARTGQKVAVLERSCYETTRIGEMLSPEIKMLLINLDLWERFLADEHLPSPGILSAWGSDELYENDFIFNPYGNGWHIDRRHFDKMLALAAEDSGAFVYRSTRAIACHQQTCGKWKIDAIRESKPVSFEANFLVEATGRSSSLIGQANNKRIYSDSLIALIKHLKLKSGEADFDQRLLVEGGENGWWYSALLPDKRVVVVYLTDPEQIPGGKASLGNFLGDALNKTQYTQARVEACEWNADLLTVPANSYRREKVIGKKWLLLGDAASTFDPLSAQGVYKAIESSFSAAKAILAYQCGDESLLKSYADTVEKNFTGYLKQREAYYNKESRWQESAFWQKRQTNSNLTVSKTQGR